MLRDLLNNAHYALDMWRFNRTMGKYDIAQDGHNIYLDNDDLTANCPVTVICVPVRLYYDQYDKMNRSSGYQRAELAKVQTVPNPYNDTLTTQTLTITVFLAKGTDNRFFIEVENCYRNEAGEVVFRATRSHGYDILAAIGLKS